MKKFNFQTKASKKREAARTNPFRSILLIGYGFCLAYLVRAYNPTETREDVILTALNEGISLLICTILITIISYNVKHNKIYVKSNANLIKLIGVVISISSCLPALFVYRGWIHNLSGSELFNYYLFVVGYFIIAIGYIFQNVVKIKEEQDLTI